jgi:uncharacterized protein YukE
MAVDQKMNYGSMREMSRAFRQASQQLEQTMNDMAKISKMMQDGALVGDGGQAFADALDNKLKKRLEVLRAKMQEMDKDIRKNVEAMGQAVDTAEDRFEN